MHPFSRNEVHQAVAKAKERSADGYLFRVREPMNPSTWVPSASPVCDAPKRMSAGQVAAADQECLEVAAAKAMGGMAALDAMLPQCPLCGGRPMDFGPTIDPKFGDLLAKGLDASTTLKHTKGCPFLEGWRAVVHALLGEKEAECLNSFERPINRG